MTPVFTPELTAETVARLRPVLSLLIAEPFVNRPGIALSVAASGPAGDLRELGDFEIGDLSLSPYPNARIARQKRGLSLRCRTAGSRVPKPDRREEDSPWTGSAWLDGLAVGCAGLTEEQDEMVAHWLAHALRAAALAGQAGDETSDAAEDRAR